MSHIVHLVAHREARQTSLDEAWKRFIEAKLKSERTLRIEDGIIAGKLYRQFLELCGRTG